MISILEKRDDIKSNISNYIENNDVRCQTTLFKNEYFTSVYFEREEQEENGITYVFPKMKKDASYDDIAKAMVERFLKENKSLGFKPEQLILMEDKYHKPLLVEALAAYTLNQDIKQIEQRIFFDIMSFTDIFEKSGDTREISNNGNLIHDGFKSVLLGSVDFNKKTSLPTMYAIAEKMGTPEGQAIMKKELGEYKQEKISSIIPKLKDLNHKNKNKII